MMNKVYNYLQYIDRVLGKDGEVYELTSCTTYDFTESIFYTYTTEDSKYKYTLSDSDIICMAIAINNLEDELDIFTTMDNILAGTLDREFAIMRERVANDTRTVRDIINTKLMDRACKALCAANLMEDLYDLPISAIDEDDEVTIQFMFDILALKITDRIYEPIVDPAMRDISNLQFIIDQLHWN